MKVLNSFCCCLAIMVLAIGCVQNSKPFANKDLQPKNWIKLDSSKVLLVDNGSFSSMKKALSQSIGYYAGHSDAPGFSFDDASYTREELLASLCLLQSQVDAVSTKKDLYASLRKNFDFYYPAALVNNSLRLTGYYTPTVSGSLKKTKSFNVPVYGLPKDLKTLDLGQFKAALKGNKVNYRETNGEAVPYFSHAEISQGAVEKSAPILAWLNNKMNLFFVQMQGSGYLITDSGKRYLLAYAGSNGLDYSSIGAALVQNGDLKLEEVSMQKIRSYLSEHTEKQDAVLFTNKNYVFFQLQNGDNPVVGSYGLGLTEERSVALDALVYPRAMPLFVRSQIPHCDNSGNCDASLSKSGNGYYQMAFNQDTGGAIRGYGRMDFYWGDTAYAEAVAGRLNAPAEVLFLIGKKALLANMDIKACQQKAAEK